jgi:hypothetical protein
MHRVHFVGRSRAIPWIEPDHQRTLKAVSTRRLIIASLLCGIAILFAGGLKLFQTTADGNRIDAALLSVGEPTVVGGVEVAVVGVERNQQETRATVEMRGRDATVADIDVVAGWRMLADGALTSPIDGTSTSGAACGSLRQSDVVTCVLTFVVANGTPTFIYSRDGTQGQWLAGG